jgi:Ca-activated chloride channel family protein
VNPRRLVVLLAILAAASVMLRAQQTFKSATDLVRVDALVTNGRGPIAGLTASDFEVRDNGVPQPVDAVTLESMPLSVGFLLDTSGSVGGTKLADLSAAVDLVLEGLHGADQAMLITFSHRVWLRTDWTSEFAGLRRAVKSADAEGATALRDAVYAGMAAARPGNARSLLLVFSDGLDNASWLPSEIVERAASRADVVVYGVAVADHSEMLVVNSLTTARAPVAVYAPGQTAFLEAIATATGGRVLKADITEHLPKAFDDILKEFRTRYVLTYYPRDVDASGWHTIDVKVKGRRADVRARRGYQR